MLRLVTSGVLIGLGVVLSFIKFGDLPYGGSVTLFSMIPVAMIGYMYGMKWGFICGLTNGVIQGLLGAATTQAFAGVSGINIVLMCILDYLIAFGVIGLAGMFYRKIKNNTISFAVGVLVVTLLRYFVHFISGILLWGAYAADWFAEPNRIFGTWALNSLSGQKMAAFYSLIYNGLYMVPEIILSVVAATIIISIPAIKKQMIQARNSI